MRRRAVTATAIVVVLLATAPIAFGQGNPFTPLPQAPPTQEAPAEPQAPVNPNDDGLSGTQKALIFAAGGVLLAGIAFAIVKDARRRAPVRDRVAAAVGPSAPDPHRERAKQRARRKQKQARAQRKRNR